MNLLHSDSGIQHWCIILHANSKNSTNVMMLSAEETKHTVNRVHITFNQSYLMLEIFLTVFLSRSKIRQFNANYEFDT